MNNQAQRDYLATYTAVQSMIIALGLLLAWVAVIL